MTTRQLL